MPRVRQRRSSARHSGNDAPHTQAASAAPAGWDSALDSTCARLARSFDLTRREEDVLRLLVEGRTFAEAAGELVVSLNTVKSHVRRIYAKMGVSGKQDLLGKASDAAKAGSGRTS